MIRAPVFDWTPTNLPRSLSQQGITKTITRWWCLFLLLRPHLLSEHQTNKTIRREINEKLLSQHRLSIWSNDTSLVMALQNSLYTAAAAGAVESTFCSFFGSLRFLSAFSLICNVFGIISKTYGFLDVTTRILGLFRFRYIYFQLWTNHSAHFMIRYRSGLWCGHEMALHLLEPTFHGANIPETSLALPRKTCERKLKNYTDVRSIVTYH